MAQLKLEKDSDLKCPTCGGVPYRLYRRQVSEGSDVFENVIWPGPEGMVPPPGDISDIRCFKCDVKLERA